ncbi:MAG: TolC family protein [Gemmataceae bacterium]|nr:TolC family protein [Gemmataceae bacterium]
MIWENRSKRILGVVGLLSLMLGCTTPQECSTRTPQAYAPPYWGGDSSASRSYQSISMKKPYCASDIVPVVAKETEDSTPTQQLTLQGTLQYALTQNPQLMAFREQHGVAAAGVVIAKTYPFNPIYQGTLLQAKNSANPVDNSFFNGHQITWEVQLFRQQKFRQQQAFAALTRTDWEIATQELTVAVNSIRAFDAYLYRKGKLAVSEEFLRLNQKSVEQIKDLVEQGKLKSGDLMVARAEVNDVQAQVNLNRTALITAKRDYYRALGIPEGSVEPVGTLERGVPAGQVEQFLAAAQELRPDRFARLAAVAEAEAEYLFQSADRFGNPQVGPVYEYDDARTRFLGAKVQFPIPVLNRKPGERLQALARRSLALAGVRQVEIEISQDVRLAVQRLAEAENWAENYRKEILPALRKSLSDSELLFEQGQGGVDVLRLLDVRRKLLRAQDGYLDALLAYTSALADLAQAVGDPALAMQPAALIKPDEPGKGEKK